MHTRVIWDSVKAAANLRKHDVSFDEAASVLFDPNALARPDTLSGSEERWVLVGLSGRLRLITLVYTLRGHDCIRLISARKSTRQEAAFYA